MIRNRTLLGLLTLLLLEPTFARAEDELTLRHWNIAGVEREALVWIPAPAPETDATKTAFESDKAKKYPLVFAFHGHGGTMRNTSRTFAIHRHWPNAIVVYMQGLKTPGRLTDPDGKKPGWQHDLGDQKDRDLHFFDAVLETISKENSVDESRVYATGHSNGGGFTYLLWAARGDVFAALAPSAAVPRIKHESKMKPKPVLHIAGENDPLVTFETQMQGMKLVRKVNECSEEGKAWAENCTIYEGTSSGKPIVTMITQGTHKFPDKAPELIVRFFKENSKPTLDP